MTLCVSLVLLTLMGHSTFQRRIKMRKGQQQIRCSSDVSIAGRTDSRPQVISLFIPVLSSPIPNPLSLTKSLSMSSCTHRLMDYWSCVLIPTLVLFPQRIQFKARIKGKKQLLMSCLFGFRYRVFVLRRRGAQQAKLWARCQKRRGQEKTQSHTFPTEATQGRLSKVRRLI